MIPDRDRAPRDWLAGFGRIYWAAETPAFAPYGLPRDWRLGLGGEAYLPPITKPIRPAPDDEDVDPLHGVERDSLHTAYNDFERPHLLRCPHLLRKARRLRTAHSGRR